MHFQLLLRLTFSLELFWFHLGCLVTHLPLYLTCLWVLPVLFHHSKNKIWAYYSKTCPSPISWSASPLSEAHTIYKESQNGLRWKRSLRSSSKPPVCIAVCIYLCTTTTSLSSLRFPSISILLNELPSILIKFLKWS